MIRLRRSYICYHNLSFLFERGGGITGLGYLVHSRISTFSLVCQRSVSYVNVQSRRLTFNLG